MDVLSIIAGLQDYLGVIVGFVLLIIACWFLPAKVRWYVLTAGLAIIAYRVFQIAMNKKRLAEADARRKELRGQHEQLKGQLKTTKSELVQLNKELDEVRVQRAKLAQEANDLAQTSGALDAQRDNLNNRLQGIVTKNNELIGKIEAREAAVSIFDQADLAFDEMEKAHQ